MITFKKTPDKKVEYGRTYDPVEVTINIDDADLCRDDLFDAFCKFLRACGYYVGQTPGMYDDEEKVEIHEDEDDSFNIDDVEPEGSPECECTRCADCTCMNDDTPPNLFVDDNK